MSNTNEFYAQQVGRGRDADAPTEIPPKGWKDISWRLYRAIAEDRILLTAAGAAFYLLLSLVPTLTAFVSIYGLFNTRRSVLDHAELLSGIVPPGALQVIRDQLTRLAAESNDTLGLTAIFALALALWSASAGIKAMFEAMNVAYHERERRNLLVLNATALLFTLGGAFAALMVAAVVLIMPVLIGYLPGGDGLEWTVRVGAYAAMLLVLSAGVAALYRWGASREQAKWRWITPGVLLAVISLGLSSIVFSWYVTNFTDDNATYGSLGSAIGLMTWLWISVTVVILGAELNSEIEHQTARDSTTGPALPLGARGAHMADTVGRVWPPDRKKAERQLATATTDSDSGGLALLVAIPAVLLALSVLRRR